MNCPEHKELRDFFRRRKEQEDALANPGLGEDRLYDDLLDMSKKVVFVWNSDGTYVRYSGKVWKLEKPHYVSSAAIEVGPDWEVCLNCGRWAYRSVAPYLACRCATPCVTPPF